MPELPEVETTRRGITSFVEGKIISSVTVRDARLRWPIDQNFSKLVSGQAVVALKRRGKYLVFELKDGAFLVHLGMSGSLRVLETAQNISPEKHDHVDINIGAEHILRFNDPRRFGAVVWVDGDIDDHPLISHLGPEPLSEEFDAEYLFTKARKKTTRIKTFLMDARVVVGVGNIYANEALFNAGVHPLKPTGKISRKDAANIVREIKSVLAYAIQRGGTTLRDFVGGDGKPGYFAQELNVYGRGGEQCKQCNKVLIERYLSNRSTVYCTDCQS